MSGKWVSFMDEESVGSTGRVRQCGTELLFFLLLHFFDRVSSVEGTQRVCDAVVVRAGGGIIFRGPLFVFLRNFRLGIDGIDR